MKLRNTFFIPLFVFAIILSGCSSNNDIETNDEIVVEILDNDGTITEVTTTKDELNGINGCFMYNDICYAQSPNPDHNGAYVPEGVDFYSEN